MHIKRVEFTIKETKKVLNQSIYYQMPLNNSLTLAKPNIFSKTLQAFNSLKICQAEKKTKKKKEKVYFSSLKYCKSVVFIPHVSFGANQSFN